MKKIFTLFAALAMVMSMSAKTIYLNTGGGGLWNQGGAKFGCHTWGSQDKSGFMTSEGGGVYSFETLDANTDVIFTRVSPSSTSIWGDNGNEWNRIQTTIPADKDYCTITGWGESDFNWSTYIPVAAYTFTKGTTLYIDFRAITDKKGANYPKAGAVGVDYSANAGGTIIPVTFTADVKWTEGDEFMKTEKGDWASISFKVPEEGQNCAQVAADGKSYTWTTYSEPTVTLSLDKTEADAGTEVTVTLTATADNITGDATYAFQYSTDNNTWNDITTATGNTATQTFAAETRYYKVTMTSGEITKEATAKFTAIKFHIIGSWDEWATHHEIVDGSKTIALAAGSTYEYKITVGNWDRHWGNEGTMTRENCTGWSFEADANAKITTDVAGDYVFNVSRNEEGKVVVSVTYPVTDEIPDPVTVSYVLMGVGGDWKVGVPMTKNEKAEGEEYMLIGQTITASDSVKVVKLVNGEAKHYCGNVKDDCKELVLENKVNDNIVLAPGVYDFYYDVAADAIWIAVSSSDPSAVGNVIVEKKAVKVIRNGQMYILRDGVMYNAIGQIAE